MTYTYHKAEPISLVDAGFDEKRLQERILEDPTILGLGELTVIQREERQSSGGRIDFLMSDPEANVMYEVEVMLGEVDESHIIRTIEYWDIERRRWPNREHRAVIVAEEITNRFFNIIGLFNRAIPLIAIQLNALTLGEKLVLNFTKVLDAYESPEVEGDDGGSEPVDRKDWERLSRPESVKIVDALIDLATEDKAPRVSYRRGDIAMGGSRKHFCWMNPRRSQARCLVYLKVMESGLQGIIDKLEAAGVSATRQRDDIIRIVVTPDDLQRGGAALRDVLIACRKAVGGD
jgi:hypothetical protein